MARAQDEAVAVEPLRFRWVKLERVAEEDGPDFGAAERQTEVAGIAGMDGVHGEAAGFVRSAGEGIEIQSHKAFF